jgi:general secretion pathway protein L
VSGADTLLIFLARGGGFGGWLRLEDGAVPARGNDLRDLPPLADPATGATIRVAAAVPGEEVSLHWAELPAGLSDPQAQAAARMIAADLGAQTADELHVAVGPEQEGALRCIALVSALHMAEWIARLQAEGMDPDLVFPEPLLIPAPQQGLLRYTGAHLPLFRGQAEAYSIEPDLAAFLGAEAKALDDAEFENGIVNALAALPVNLRQGPFAKTRRWGVDWKRVRRIAWMAAGVLALALAVQVTSLLRYTFAADEAEQEALALAQQAAPGSTPAQLELRLAQTGADSGFAPLAAALFNGVRATPNVQVSAITFDRAGGLRATIAADTPASIAALQQQIASSGFSSEAGVASTQSGRPTAELTVRER